MTSQIDATVPIAGAPTTASVRANFATAAGEISNLQAATVKAPYLPLSGGDVMTGPLYLDRDPTDPRQAVTKAYADAHTGSGVTGIPEAPADATLYGRQDGSWKHAVNTAELNAAITAALVPATETISGIAKIATSAQATAGTDNATIITPLKLAAQITAASGNYLPITGGTITGSVLRIQPATANNDAALVLRRSGATNANGIFGLDETGANRWVVYLGYGSNANAFSLQRIAGAATSNPLTIDNNTSLWTLDSGMHFGITGSVNSAPCITGAITPASGAADLISMAARYLAAPVAGNNTDGGSVSVYGSSHPTLPNAAVIYAGSRATSYKQWTFDANGITSIPGNLVLSGNGTNVNISATNVGTGGTDCLYIFRTINGDGGVLQLSGPTAASPNTNGSFVYAGPASGRKMWAFQQDGSLLAPGNIYLTGANASLYFGGVGTVAGLVHGTDQSMYMQIASNYFFGRNGSNGYWYITENAVNSFIMSPIGQLTVGNKGYQPGGGPWADSSDARIKTVLGEYKQGLAEVLKLEPKRFVYRGNDLGNDASKAPDPRGENDPYPESPHYHVAMAKQVYTGLVAQDVEPVFPDMITHARGYIDGEAVDDVRILDTSPLIYALVNSVKELHARITALEAA
jgi:hypothetical protein